jgi:hypothetical protein
MDAAIPTLSGVVVPRSLSVGLRGGSGRHGKAAEEGGLRRPGAGMCNRYLFGGNLGTGLALEIEKSRVKR